MRQWMSVDVTRGFSARWLLLRGRHRGCVRLLSCVDRKRVWAIMAGCCKYIPMLVLPWVNSTFTIRDSNVIVNSPTWDTGYIWAPAPSPTHWREGINEKGEEKGMVKRGRNGLPSCTLISVQWTDYIFTLLKTLSVCDRPHWLDQRFATVYNDTLKLRHHKQLRIFYFCQNCLLTNKGGNKSKI